MECSILLWLILWLIGGGLFVVIGYEVAPQQMVDWRVRFLTVLIWPVLFGCACYVMWRNWDGRKNRT
jgi:hypothetical protein